MSKAEIIAELARLGPEDLAELRALIDRLAVERSGSKANGPSPRIRTPRLANPAQARDFIKQVKELPADARL